MGARLVGAALSPTWAHLHDKPMRVLVYMCLRARDTPTPETRAGEFWGGHEELARMLTGRDDITSAELQQVTRCMRELRKEGAVTIISQAHPGRAPRYRIDVERGCSKPVDNPPVDTAQEPPEEPEWVSKSDTQWVSETDTHMGIKKSTVWVSKTDTPQETTQRHTEKEFRPNPVSATTH